MVDFQAVRYKLYGDTPYFTGLGQRLTTLELVFDIEARGIPERQVLEFFGPNKELKPSQKTLKRIILK